MTFTVDNLITFAVYLAFLLGWGIRLEMRVRNNEMRLQEICKGNEDRRRENSARFDVLTGKLDQVVGDTREITGTLRQLIRDLNGRIKPQEERAE